MDNDDLLEPIHQSLAEDFFTLLNRNLIDVAAFVAKYYRFNPAATIVSQHCGSFNFSLRLHWDDGKPDWLIRFPIPGKVFFVEEKYKNEVAIMQLLRQNSTVPVPDVVGYGTAAENPTGLGPFIIMTWIDGIRMYDVMKRKDQAHDSPDFEDILDPYIEDSVLRTLYGEIAKIFLELWSMDFDKIGGFDFECAASSLKIDRRPLTMNMNDLIMDGGIPEQDLSSGPFSSSLDYFMHLAKLHSVHLQKQRNAICDSQDCREKYTCRCLLKSIIPLFTDMDDNNGPFRLFSEDLTPGNILIDPKTLKITGVIDWEFCYAAPAQLFASPPKWLLLKMPEHWVEDDGLESFINAYQPKLDMFLQEIEKHEASNPISVQHHNKLSTRMRQSMGDRKIWFNRAVRGGWSLDFIYWNLLDNYVYGPATIMERVAKTTGGGDALHRDREALVRTKIEQLGQYHSECGSHERIEYRKEPKESKQEFWLPSASKVRYHPFFSHLNHSSSLISQLT